MIQIVYKEMSLWIDVDSLIITDDVSTVFSMHDMITNGLDLFIQNCHIRL